ncbi:Dihydroxy-acid dehydratase 1 [Rhizophlyctis rosea]|nr:Dihydroxy-acid dehydratase 1 [Rhizophlyctis rosea]
MTQPKLRSQQWFANSANPGMTALYLERYLNYGLTREELQSGKPLIGIAQTGSDLAPCNRHHVELSKRVQAGIIAAGGVPFEFPCHPIQETGKRPTAMLDRNLAYLSLVEVLHGYPLDGVVLLIGCDKTMPALTMAAATTNIPALALSVGPMLNGTFDGKRIGSGTIIWEARKRLSREDIDYEDFMEIVASSAPSVGYCNSLGTAATMNMLSEALGMQLTGYAAIPAPYRERAQAAYNTGKRIVDMVREGLTPSKILTREAFENAIVVCSAIGGSTNAPIHLNAIAKHLSIKLDNDDWQNIGHKIPLLANIQPAGEYLGEDLFKAGGLPAIISELIRANLLPHPNLLTATGKSLTENCANAKILDPTVIFPIDKPLKKDAGFLNMKGNLFRSALMKTSVISARFTERYLSNPADPNAFEGRVVVFDGPEDYHARIDDPAENIDEHCILVMRGAGPVGYPGSAEVVNMQPPSYLLKKGIEELPCIGDGRQSGTSGSPSILNASPEAATDGNLAILRNGDILRVDLNQATVNVAISDEEIARRKEELQSQGGYKYPAHQTPWQELYRLNVSELDEGGVLRMACKYLRVNDAGVPRDNH